MEESRDRAIVARQRQAAVQRLAEQQSGMGGEIKSKPSGRAEMAPPRMADGAVSGEPADGLADSGTQDDCSEVIDVCGRLFTVLGSLGRGGSARVLKVQKLPDNKRESSAEGADLQSVCALKVIACSSRAQMSGYMQEIRFLSFFAADPTVQHIVRILDYQVDESNLKIYVFLELADATLEKVCREAPLPLELLEDLTAQMICAVREMHAKGVVHFDLKPANVLLFRNPAYGTPVSGVQRKWILKVADFGVAILLRPLSPAVSFRRPVGTPKFMSPELLVHARFVTSTPKDAPQSKEDARNMRFGRPVDVWGLGVCMYAMLHPLPRGELARRITTRLCQPNLNQARCPEDPDRFRHFSMCQAESLQDEILGVQQELRSVREAVRKVCENPSARTTTASYKEDMDHHCQRSERRSEASQSEETQESCEKRLSEMSDLSETLRERLESRRWARLKLVMKRCLVNNPNERWCAEELARIMSDCMAEGENLPNCSTLPLGLCAEPECHCRFYFREGRSVDGRKDLKDS